MTRSTRRRVLSGTATTAAVLAGLAGCLGGGGDDGTTTDGTTTTTDGDGSGGTPSDGNGGTTTTTQATTTREYVRPDAEFQFVYDPDAGALMMAHGGVEAFTEENTDRLAIRVDGEEAATWELPVEPADQTSVEASPGATVEVVWVAPSGREEVVGSYDIPSS